MIPRFLLTCLLALPLLGAEAPAPALTQAEEVAALMAKHWSGVQTFKAQFREIYRGRLRRGELVFKKPSLMRVRYFGGDGQAETEIVVGRKKLFVYLKTVNVVSEQDLTAEAGGGDLLTAGPLNALRLSKLYYFNFIDAKVPVPVLKAEEIERMQIPDRKIAEARGWRVSLTPRDITQGLERMELLVDEEGAVRRCKARTVDDRGIDVVYFDLKANETVGDKEFDFEVPASAQVVKNALLRAEHPEVPK